MTRDRKKAGLYWMENENWYHEDPDGNLVINDDAPEEARQNYERWLKLGTGEISIFDNLGEK